MRHKAAVGLLAVGSLVGMGYIAKYTGTEFVSEEDRGQFVTEITLPAGTSLDEHLRLTLAMEKQILADKRFVTLLTTLGPDGDTNKAKLRVVAVPKDERTVGAPWFQAIVRRMGPCDSRGEGGVITPPPFVEGAQTEAPIMVQVRAPTYDVIEPLAKQFQAALQGIPGVTDVEEKFDPPAGASGSRSTETAPRATAFRSSSSPAPSGRRSRATRRARCGRGRTRSRSGFASPPRIETRSTTSSG